MAWHGFGLDGMERFGTADEPRKHEHTMPLQLHTEMVGAVSRAHAEDARAHSREGERERRSYGVCDAVCVM